MPSSVIRGMQRRFKLRANLASFLFDRVIVNGPFFFKGAIIWLSTSQGGVKLRCDDCVEFCTRGGTWKGFKKEGTRIQVSCPNQ